MRTETPPAVLLKAYEPYPFAIERVSLDLSLDPDATKVVTVMQVRRTGAAGCDMVMNGEAFEAVGDIAIDGVVKDAASARVSDTGLTLVSPPDSFELRTEVTVSPKKNTELSGLYMSGGRFCTQCEAEGFRRITFWPDRPDVMSVFSVRMDADPAFETLLSNGNLTKSGTLENGRIFAQWHDPFLKPSYLFAICAGEYDVLKDSFTTMSGRDVALGVYVDTGEKDRAHYAMDSLKRSMKWDEEVFGREYDLDIFNIVAVRDFNFGAMENKGLNIFNAAYVLADAETATDADFEAIESIVAHEYFHNWTGNRITCRDWFQLCLKEGLTVFRDQEFSADMRSRPVQRIKEVVRLRGRQFAEDAGPFAHSVRPSSYGRIDNLYTATVYEKGAELIRALKTSIGDGAFRQGVANYFERFDGTASTIEDFYSAFEGVSDLDLEAFQVWYAQAGTPVVTARTERIDGENATRLTLRQSTPATPGQPEKTAVPIPLRMAAFDGSGQALPLGLNAGDEGDLFLLTEDEASLTLPSADPDLLVSLNRNFSAPVRIEQGLSSAERLRLAEVETDPFAKWDALQTLARETIVELAEGVRANRQGSVDAALVEAIAGAVRTAKADDSAYAALLLTLPGIGEMFRELSPSDPQALFEGKRQLRSALRGALADDFSPNEDSDTGEAFSPDAASAGRRALAAAWLDLLAADGEIYADDLHAAFNRADNMTDTMAALRALAQTGSPAFDSALESFEARWNGSPIVMDKWFGVQAGMPDVSAIDRARNLMQRGDFEWTNPNRVRSVVATLAMGNHIAFHAADGSGYRFLGEVVEKVDPLNGALSARLMTAFEQWRLMDKARQTSAKAVLDNLNTLGLSGNAQDILTRALKED